jgi:hypothetical protein
LLRLRHTREQVSCRMHSGAVEKAAEH